MSDGRRVVVTGLGMVSPLGVGWRAAWDSALEGTSTAGTITRFDPSGHACRIACEVRDFVPADHIERRALRRMDRVSQFAVAASRLALEDAGLEIDGDGERAGVVMSTGNGSSESFEEHHRNLLDRGPDRASPLMVPVTIVNMSAGHVSIELGLRGPSSCVVTACASGNNAIGEALEMIRRDAADVIITGATEAALVPVAMAGMNVMTALSTRNEDPVTASRPFDKDRDGFLMGEGAGMLILESLEHAQARGATILGEVTGYGTTDDAHHISAPAENGAGAAMAMKLALQNADLEVNDIGYINAHGTSTPLNDKSETAAIKTVFGEQAYNIPVSSTGRR